MTPVVQTTHVSKWYGQVIGLNDVSVTVPAGVTGLLADLISRNRQLIEESLWRIRRVELGESTRTDKKD